MSYPSVIRQLSASYLPVTGQLAALAVYLKHDWEKYDCSIVSTIPLNHTDSILVGTDLNNVYWHRVHYNICDVKIWSKPGVWIFVALASLFLATRAYLCSTSLISQG